MFHLFLLFCSLVAAVPLDQRQDKVDVDSLENKLKTTIENIGKEMYWSAAGREIRADSDKRLGATISVQTTDLQKALSDIITLADAILANPEFECKVSAKVSELSRAIILLSDLANDFALIGGDNEKLYRAAAAVKATGEAILDIIQFVGEDLIRFNFSHKENDRRNVRLSQCWGLSLGKVCIGAGWR